MFKKERETKKKPLVDPKRKRNLGYFMIYQKSFKRSTSMILEGIPKYEWRKLSHLRYIKPYHMPLKISRLKFRQNHVLNV